MRRSRPTGLVPSFPTVRVIRWLAAALHHIAAVTAAAAVVAAHEPGEPTANGGVLAIPAAAATTPQEAATQPAYRGMSAYGFFDVGDCTPSPLWAKEVDATSYELGCEEIEVSRLYVSLQVDEVLLATPFPIVGLTATMAPRAV